ncbi:MAG: sensor domain-containing diguanylate cyclase [Humidesulfovibrio sp.]|nr:sensor domain-containing diguanylate cyclase [Desulfovibrio sp.]MDO9084247.1 sensor domain-containing diguanylate cyclase [Humidesulfovibrio sp.]
MTQHFYKNLIDSLYDGVYFVDANRTITYWNRGAERISGFSAEEVSGRSCADNLLMHVDQAGTQLCLCGCPLMRTLNDGVQREAEVFLHHKAGHRVPVSVRIAPMHDESGRIIGAVEIFTDNSSRRDILKELRELKHMALADPLTELGNRRFAGLEFERMSNALCRYNVPFGLLFADIDNFKDVNDTFGHEVGDRVLVMVAKTLASALRGTDKVSRWGGEEFVVLVPDVDADLFWTIAERMRQLVEASSLPVPGGMLRVTVSVGGSLAVAADTLESLAERADAMMYRSKDLGRNRTTLDCA